MGGKFPWEQSQEVGDDCVLKIAANSLSLTPLEGGLYFIFSPLESLLAS